MNIHFLKCSPDEYTELHTTDKEFFCRKNDRNFSPDDIVILICTNTKGTIDNPVSSYTSARVIHIDETNKALKKGYCIIGLRDYYYRMPANIKVVVELCLHKIAKSGKTFSYCPDFLNSGFIGSGPIDDELA